MNHKNQYSNPEFEIQIQMAKQRQLTAYKLLGQEHAWEDKPSTATEVEALIVSSIHADIQELIHFNSKVNEPQSGIAYARERKLQAEQALHTLRVHTTELRLKKDALENQLRLKPHDKWKKAKRIAANCAMVILSLIDGLMSFPALRTLKYLPFTCIILSLGIGIAVSTFGYATARLMNSARAIERKCAWFVFGSLPVLFIFYALGRLRANSLNHTFIVPGQKHAIDSVSGVCWLDIMVFSYLLFVAGVIICYRFMQTKEEVKADKQAEICAHEIDSIELNLVETTRKISEIEQHAAEDVRIAVERFAYGANIERDLINFSLQAFATYKNANLASRRDRQIPECLRIPHFEFQLFFTVKQKSHEYIN